MNTTHITKYNDQKGSVTVAQSLAQEKLYTEADYYNLPENVRAELIDGRIYYQSAPSRIHQEILNYLNTEINIYIRSKDGKCRVYPAPFAVKLHQDKKNIVEPDISVICDPDKLTDKGCSGAPDWIIEIVSPGSRRIDYFTKLFKYRTAGVREYWIVDPDKKRITVYDFESEDIGDYTFSDSVKAGIYNNLYINFADIADLLDS